MTEPARIPGRWHTLPTERTVVVLAHTVASLMRVRDYAALLESDSRILLQWTAVPDRFNSGVPQLLDRLDVPVLPWQTATETETAFDLAIGASLHQMERPNAKRRFAAPHGCGYGKRYPSWAWPTNEPQPVYGLDRQSLLDQDGRPVLDGLVLSHNDQLDVLNEQCPEAAHAAVIAGDLAMDRLLASLPFRETYRLGFDVRRGQTLVVVATTWGRESLLARFPDLPARLIRELPADHRVIMTMHPAVWYEHGPRHICACLRAAQEAGLDLIGPGADWRPLVASADIVISDHTSLTSYAAAAGVPVLLSHYADDEIAPGSLIAELAANSPRLDPVAPLKDQFDAARRARAAQHEIGARRVSSVQGRSAAIVRRTLYNLMKLPEPPMPPRVDHVPPGELYRPDFR